MSDGKVEGVGDEMYPLVTTDDGQVVIYRGNGDAWQVAASKADVDFFTSPEQHRVQFEVVLALPAPSLEAAEVEAVAREMREYAYSKPDNSDAFRVTLDRVEGWADRLDAARKGERDE